MEYNLAANLSYCYQFFVDSEALLYYTHIPPIAVALIFAGYVLYARRDFPALLLATFALIFSAFAIFDLLQWILIGANTFIVTSWSLLGLLSAFLFFFLWWFTHTFLTGEHLPKYSLGLWAIALVPVLVFTPTHLNLDGFDVRDCIATEGTLFTNYYYGLGVLAMLMMAIAALRTSKIAVSHNERWARMLVLIAAELFALSFLTTGVIASYLVDNGFLADFGLGQYGIAAMALFIGMLGYASVEYKAFNTKTLAAQALVVGLVVLVASEFLFIDDVIGYILASLTLVLVFFFGFALVRSVRREVKQREELEVLAKNLEAANNRLKELDRLKSEFLSIASHQLRAPITAVRGYASNIAEGEYGPIPDYLKDPLQTMQESSRLMVNSIEDYLNISRIEQNRMKYEKSDFDIADLAKKVVKELVPVAEKRKLALTIAAPENLMVNADIGKIKQVITNLVDNAVKYTKQGSVTVTVEHANKQAKIVIADTGIGIAPDEIGGLFEKFKRARGANQVNTTGTGLGLYVAKQLIEGNGGKVRVESDGLGKGSRFIIELPALT